MITPKRSFLFGNGSVLLFSGRLMGAGMLITSLMIGCKTSAPPIQQAPSKPVILTLGDKSFSTDDFFQSFTKNQMSADSNQRTDIKDYLELYTNLKLKVLAAEQQGRDTTEGFREELATYRKQLANSYLTDKVMVDNMTAEAYQRMQQEVDVSHLLIPASEDASPADTLAAYENALALRKRILNGEDFATLARQYSKDQASALKGGRLGFLTAFNLTYPLETAAYQTPLGGISTPVRTKFGYHLVRPNERRPSRGKIRVAHILVRISPGVDKIGEDGARNRIDEIYARLQNGESFEAVCRETSDDLDSRSNGGLLPLRETGRNVPEFEDAAFSLTTPGQYTKPVRTNYGWHIIKLIERKPLESYQELAPALRQKVVTDTRSEVLHRTTVQRLRTEYKVDENRSVVAAAIAKADSSLLLGRWKFTEPLEPALEGKALFTIDNKPSTVNTFFAFVQQHQLPIRMFGPPGGPVPAIAMQRFYNRFVGEQLIEAEDANLERKFPELRALMAEIHDGVLLAQVMEENVWERSMTDSLGQRQYYEQNKEKYRYPERASASIIIAPNDDVLKQIGDMMAKSPYQLRRSAPELVFDKNQAILTPKLKENLFEVIVAMTRNPGYIVEISGSHEPSEADSVSASRIKTVMNYLRQNGIPMTRIMEKDEKAFRAGATNPAAHRRVTFQYYSTQKEDIARVLNSKTPNSVTITEGLYTKGSDPYINAVGWQPGSTVLHPNGKAVQVIINRVDPARIKTFDEARGTVINEYQGVLEKQWLARLRQQYPVNVNEEELRKLIK